MPIKYGDMFNVSGELAAQPVAPRERYGPWLASTLSNKKAAIILAASHPIPMPAKIPPRCLDRSYRGN
jgi:hypothetical protein